MSLDSDFFENPDLLEVRTHLLSSKRAPASVANYLNNRYKSSKLRSLIDAAYGETSPEKLYCFAHNITSQPLCNCGEPVSFLVFSKGYRTFCSSKCAQVDPMVVQKTKQTRMGKYGTEHLSKSNVAKLKQTKVERFGFEHQMLNRDVVDKRSSTMNGRYGGVGFASSSINDKIEQTMIARFGAPRNSLVPELTANYSRVRKIESIQKYKNSLTNFEIDVSDEEYLGNTQYLKMKCVRCGILELQNFSHGGPSCSRCDQISGKSKPELELYDFCKKLLPNTEILSGFRIFGKSDQRSVDIYIPEYKLAIEFNGLYWHSDLFRNEQYHLNKTNDVAALGVKLIHVFEDDFMLRKTIVESIISNAVGLSKRVYARNCQIVEIAPKVARTFLTTNHLQGFIAGKYYVALKLNNEIISVMVVSRTRFSKKYNWELGRWATKCGYVCVGGFSKCLKFIKRKIQNDPILTYCDNSHSDGGTYRKFGVELYKTAPNYFYFRNSEWWRHNRMQFQKHKLIGLPQYSLEKTEREIMQDAGWFRIYDCGNLVFEL